MRSAFISSEFSYESLIIGVVRSGAVTFVLVLFPGDVVAANPAPYSFVIANRGTDTDVVSGGRLVKLDYNSLSAIIQKQFVKD
jgi:hypothetical protein